MRFQTGLLVLAVLSVLSVSVESEAGILRRCKVVIAKAKMNDQGVQVVQSKKLSAALHSILEGQLKIKGTVNPGTVNGSYKFTHTLSEGGTALRVQFENTRHVRVQGTTAARPELYDMSVSYLNTNGEKTGTVTLTFDRRRTTLEGRSVRYSAPIETESFEGDLVAIVHQEDEGDVREWLMKSRSVTLKLVPKKTTSERSDETIESLPHDLESQAVSNGDFAGVLGSLASAKEIEWTKPGHYTDIRHPLRIPLRDFEGHNANVTFNYESADPAYQKLVKAHPEMKTIYRDRNLISSPEKTIIEVAYRPSSTAIADFIQLKFVSLERSGADYLVTYAGRVAGQTADGVVIATAKQTLDTMNVRPYMFRTESLTVRFVRDSE